MKIQVIPINVGKGGIVELVGDCLQVWAQDSPRDYDWQIIKGKSGQIEIEYLSACLAINIWLTHFKPSTPIRDTIFNV